MQAAIEQTEERGFAHAIAPDQPDFLTRGDGDRGAIKQDLGTAAQDQIAKRDQSEADSNDERGETIQADSGWQLTD